MNTEPIVISNEKEAIAKFGQPLISKRKTTVSIREPYGTEVFPGSKNKGDLTAISEIDYVLVPTDNSKSYPCKKDIFHNTWEEAVKGTGIYRKKAVCRSIPIPKDVVVIVKTLEGDVEAAYPSHIAIGSVGEVWTYSEDFINKNLVFEDK
jgi:hypothetical protein